MVEKKENEQGQGNCAVYSVKPLSEITVGRNRPSFKQHQRHLSPSLLKLSAPSPHNMALTADMGCVSS